MPNNTTKSSVEQVLDVVFKWMTKEERDEMAFFWAWSELPYANHRWGWDEWYTEEEYWELVETRGAEEYYMHLAALEISSVYYLSD